MNEYQNPSLEQQSVIRKPSLHTVSMTELYDMAFPPRSPVIEGLLYSGTYLFAGSPKIGKSFFMSQLGYHVATGTSLWDYPVRQGSVLYLALEDDYGRLQGRLNQMFGVEAVDGLHFATKARTLADGLNGSWRNFSNATQTQGLSSWTLCKRFGRLATRITAIRWITRTSPP